jgi:hypothetical protein
VDDAQLAGALLEDLLVEPVTAMTGWNADSGGRAFAGCLLEWIAGVHADVDEPEPHEQGTASRRQPATRSHRPRPGNPGLPASKRHLSYPS